MMGRKFLKEKLLEDRQNLVVFRSPSAESVNILLKQRPKLETMLIPVDIL